MGNTDFANTAYATRVSTSLSMVDIMGANFDLFSPWCWSILEFSRIPYLVNLLDGIQDKMELASYILGKISGVFKLVWDDEWVILIDKGMSRSVVLWWFRLSRGSS